MTPSTVIAGMDELETRIHFAALRLATAPTAELRTLAWLDLQALHGQRTAERIHNMEVEQGLDR